MKRILITGSNSYVGSSVEKWLLDYPEKYIINTLDMKNPNWIEHNFSNYDVVFHVAGIAHVANNKKNDNLYFRINRDLAIETATKAKNENVNHFIFMSSMIVFSSKEDIITLETKPKPDTSYGMSKLEAENGILKLSNENFLVSIIRSPMVYGLGSKGNFIKLLKLASKTPIFPKLKNTRSTLYIKNLVILVVYLIDFSITGILHPQNNEFFCTSQFVKDVAEIKYKKTYFTKLFNPLIIVLRNNVPTFSRLFSDFYYSKELSKTPLESKFISQNESLREIIEGENE